MSRRKENDPFALSHSHPPTIYLPFTTPFPAPLNVSFPPPPLLVPSVLRNGDMSGQPSRILVPQHATWDQVLFIITERIKLDTGAVRRVRWYIVVIECRQGMRKNLI